MAYLLKELLKDLAWDLLPSLTLDMGELVGAKQPQCGKPPRLLQIQALC